MCNLTQPQNGHRLEALLADAPISHPRLFLPAGEEAELQAKIKRDNLMCQVFARMLENAEHMLNAPLLEHEMVGKRLLDVSRLALLRMLNWGLAYRLSGDAKYAKRAEADLLAMSAFSDWNPEHFLDTAEMITAAGIGYDWFYNSLGEDARSRIRQAIVEKGIEPSFAGRQWWVDVHHNWNQVCHGGLVVGALAIFEDEPELAKRTIQRALDNIHHSMQVYAPDGNYPEGPSYWSFGTSYNLLLIESLQTVLKSDFDLAQAEGFLDSATYFLHTAGPTGMFYNYSDADLCPKLSPGVFWFSARTNDSSLHWREVALLRESLQSGENPFSQNRLLPMLFIWSESFENVTVPAMKSWYGEGGMPVAMHRSSWTDRQALFLGFKGGSPSQNHAHMDIGGFVLEANGVRWAWDLEKQAYHELESKGIRIFNKVQRWTVFRSNNFSHNVLTVDGQLQNYEGQAAIIHHEVKGKMPHTIIDMTEVYAGQLERVRRGAGIHADGFVVIRDELQALDKATQVRWAMVTYAEVSIDHQGQATLRDAGQSLTLRLESSFEGGFEIYDIESAPNDFEADNPGAKMIGFTALVPANAAGQFTVLFFPGDGPEQIPELGCLADWRALEVVSDTLA